MSSPSPSSLRMNSTGSTNSKGSQIISNPLSLDNEFQKGLQGYQTSLDRLINKNYMSGYLKKKNDLGPDKTPFIQRKWTDWYVELNGTSLMFWSVKSPSDCEHPRLEVIKKKNPNFINIADCNIYTTRLPEAPYAFILNSAGANRFFFQTLSEDELSIWVLAIRLACFEISVLHEQYTSLVLNSEVYSPILYEKRGSSGFGGFIEMRCSGMLEWCRFWMSIRNDSEGRVTIAFSPAKYSTDFLFVINDLQQAYVIYPEQTELIDQASVIRLDGEIRALRDPGVNQANPPFILVMASTQPEMVSTLLTLFDHFHLHGRPKKCAFIPPPVSSSLYLDLPEIMAAPVIDVPFKDTRKYLLDTCKHKFGVSTVYSEPDESSVDLNLNIDPVPENILDSEPEHEEPEENEFEPTGSHRVSTIGTGNRGSVPSAFAMTSPKPKIRKSVSVSWKDETNENESLVFDHQSPPSSSGVNSTSHKSDSPEQETLLAHPEAEIAKDQYYPDEPKENSLNNESNPTSLAEENQRSTSINDSHLKTNGTKPAQDDEDSEASDKLESSSDDDDDIDFLKVRVAKPTRPTRKVPLVQPKVVDSDESSDDENKKTFAELDTVNDLTSKLTLNNLKANIDPSARPNSAFNSVSPTKTKLQARPFSMAPGLNGKETKEASSTSAPTRRPAPRSKVSLPTASDSSSEDDSAPKKNPGVGGGSSAEGVNYAMDDDAPIGASFAPTDPYGNPAMRSTVYGQHPGAVEYGPDGMAYYVDPQAQAMGYPPYDPQAMGYPQYDPHQNMPAFNTYNPALQRPSTLLEAQDFARYNDQLAMNQPRYGPLIQLATKKTAKPSGGLVGAISALEQQRAANKYTNANARMSHVSHIDQERNNFERQKERYLMEQRAMASQSQMFTPDIHYSHYGPGGYPGMDPGIGMMPTPNMGNHMVPQQMGGPPMRARSPYGNNGASLSAGSFYHPVYNNMMSPSATQNHLGPSDYPPYMNPGGMPPYMVPGGQFHPQNRSQEDFGPSGFARSYSQGEIYGDPYQLQHLHPNYQSPPISGGPPDEVDDEDDDKPVGMVMNNKAMSTNPMLAKGRYREHTVSQLKVNKDEDEDDSESEPEIDDDVQESFEEFVDSRLQMKPYAFAAPEKVFQAFVDHCQDADLDSEDVPDAKTFAYMMGQAGFVCKKRPPEGDEMWYNIAIIED